MPPVKTYTRIWKGQPVMYTIQDIVLPVPIPLVGAAIFVGLFIPMAGLVYGVLGLPWSSPFVAILAIGVPAGAAWLANSPIWDGKNIFEWLSCQVSHFFEPKVLSDMRADDEAYDTFYVVEQKIWKPNRPLTEAEMNRERKKNQLLDRKSKERQRKIDAKAKKKQKPAKLYGKKGKKR